MLDYIIKNGFIIDGTGNDRFRGDIGIKDGKIKFVGTCDEDAGEVIDADGLFVSPGFIDYHSHSDYALLDEAVNFGNFLEQGITTEIAGMCGGTVAPAKLEDVENTFAMLYGKPDREKAAKIAEDLRDFKSYFKSLDKRRLGTNIGFYIGH
ncbi:MAG: D-aminoacylase, partial [Deltaproteobacteria bacterium]|nr:D-aminoacylase [Deltaproteobacteria bacterium]